MEFAGSLAHELGFFGFRINLVQSGHGPSTRFVEDAVRPVETMIPASYEHFAGPVFASFANPGIITTSGEVAETIWAAVDDETGQLRLPAGRGVVGHKHNSSESIRVPSD